MHDACAEEGFKRTGKRPDASMLVLRDAPADNPFDGVAVESPGRASQRARVVPQDEDPIWSSP